MSEILIIFDTRYGSTMQLALEVAEGVKSIAGAEPVTRRVRLTEPESILDPNQRYKAAQAQFSAIREVDLEDMARADAIVTGCPTRFGGMTAAMRELWDRTGVLWQEKKLLGKVGAVFATTSTPHGGNEMTLFSLMTPMLHHGMVMVFPGYGDTVYAHTASPYGATWVAGPGSDHDPDEATRRAAMYLGERVASVAVALGGRKVLHEVR